MYERAKSRNKEVSYFMYYLYSYCPSYSSTITLSFCEANLALPLSSSL
jgi:hypothetical protein